MAAMRAATRHVELLARGSAATAALGLLLRFTVRDEVPALAALYYALPLAVVAGLLVLSAGLWLAIRRRRLALAAFLLGGGCAVGWLRGTWINHAPAQRGSESVRVLFWNVARLPFGPTRAWEQIHKQRPDLVALVESGGMTRVRPALPDGYEVAHLGGGLTVLARGKITTGRFVTWGERNRIGACSIELHGMAWPILVVDLDSHPWAPRPEALRKVAEAGVMEQAAVILGDFNTPADATCFSVLRETYQQAFEVAGHGLHATWPSFAPVLALDQIWVHRNASVLEAKYVTCWASDHRMVVAELQRMAPDRGAMVRRPDQPARAPP